MLQNYETYGKIKVPNKTLYNRCMRVFFLGKNTGFTLARIYADYRFCLATMKSCVFRAHGFGCVPFILPEKTKGVFFIMKLVRRIIAAVMVAAMCLTTLVTTAFAAGTKLYGLTKDEVFDAIWDELTYSVMGLEASLMYDELKQFVSELEITSLDYDAAQGNHDFKEWYSKKHENMKISTYNKTVIDYLKEHPNADLTWSGTSSEYSVSDKNILVYKGSKSIDDPYMQYDPENIDDLIIWTYDSDKEQFIGKDESGKLVKKVTAYSKPYGYRETSNTSKQEESLNSEVSEIETTSTDQESEPEEMIVAESKASVVTTESNTKTSAVEDQPDSPVHVVEESAAADTSAVTNSKGNTEPVTAEASEDSPTEEENSNNDNSTTTIIIICGVVIAGVFAFLIIRQKKKV